MMAVNIPALADRQGVTYKVLNISSIDDLRTFDPEGVIFHMTCSFQEDGSWLTYMT